MINVQFLSKMIVHFNRDFMWKIFCRRRDLNPWPSYSCHLAWAAPSLLRCVSLQFIGLPLFVASTFFCSASSGLVLDGSIDLFKLPHSKCRRFNLKEFFWELRESNPGLLGEKRERYLCAMPPPLVASTLGDPAKITKTTVVTGRANMTYQTRKNHLMVLEVEPATSWLIFICWGIITFLCWCLPALMTTNCSRSFVPSPWRSPWPFGGSSWPCPGEGGARRPRRRRRRPVERRRLRRQRQRRKLQLRWRKETWATGSNRGNLFRLENYSKKLKLNQKKTLDQTEIVIVKN